MTTETEKKTLREKMQAFDVEALTPLTEQLEKLYEDAKEAECETSAYGLILEKIRAHAKAALDAVKAGPKAG